MKSITRNLKLLLQSVLFLTFIIVLSILSCIPYYVPEDQDPYYQGDDPEIKSIFWEPDMDGYIQFYTNESRYLGVDGWTFWK